MAAAATPATDIFGRTPLTTLKPILADMATIVWSKDTSGNTSTDTVDSGEHITKATNLQLSYQQNVTRRRTLGGQGNAAVIIPSQPNGSVSIQRLYAQSVPNASAGNTSASLFDLPGFNVCQGLAQITIQFDGSSAYPACVTGTTAKYICAGCIVTGYSLTAEAESLTVVDNLQIEFLQMRASAPL